MSTLIPDNFETVSPTEAEATLARESSRRAATHKLGRRSSVLVQLFDVGEEVDDGSFGNADWQQRTAKQLGLEATLRPRGRSWPSASESR